MLVDAMTSHWGREIAEKSSFELLSEALLLPSDDVMALDHHAIPYIALVNLSVLIVPPPYPVSSSMYHPFIIY